MNQPPPYNDVIGFNNIQNNDLISKSTHLLLKILIKTLRL